LPKGPQALAGLKQSAERRLSIQATIGIEEMERLRDAAQRRAAEEEKSSVIATPAVLNLVEVTKSESTESIAHLERRVHSLPAGGVRSFKRKSQKGEVKEAADEPPRRWQASRPQPTVRASTPAKEPIGGRRTSSQLPVLLQRPQTVPTVSEGNIDPPWQTLEDEATPSRELVEGPHEVFRNFKAIAHAGRHQPQPVLTTSLPPWRRAKAKQQQQQQEGPLALPPDHTAILAPKRGGARALYPP